MKWCNPARRGGKASGFLRLRMLVLILLLQGVLAGCGSIAGSSGPETSGQQSATPGRSIPADGSKEASASGAVSPDARNLPDVTLKFFFLGDKRAATDEVWQAIADQVHDTLHAEFDINFIPYGDYKDKLLMMTASGDKWDMNFDGDWLAYPAMVLAGGYRDLGGMLDVWAPTLAAKYREQGTLKTVTVNGKILGLPWTMKMNQRNFLLWRKDLTDAAGISQEKDSIRTVEELDAFLYRLKSALPGQKLIGSAMDGMINQKWELSQIPSVGNDLYIDLNDPACRVVALETHPAFREVATYAHKWYRDGILARDALISKEDGATLWRNGQFAVSVTSHEWANADQSFADPAWTTESSEVYPDRKYPNRTPLANIVCLNRNAANPERTLMFLDRLETDSVLYDLVQYGIEGKTYVLRDGAAVYPDGMDGTTSNYMEWGGQWAFWKPQFMRPNATYPKGFWVREEEFASRANNIISPIDGLFINTDSIRNELVRRSQINEEFGKPIRFGVTKDADASVDEYVTLQKNAGREKIIAEVQKQVDAYLASGH